MADFSKTVSNSVNVFAGGPTSLWNAHNWNAFRWGEGTVDVIHRIMHVVSESSSLDSAINRNNIRHKLDGEAIAVTSETTSERLTDGSGYTYIFVSNATDAENRDDVTWTSAASGSRSWTSASLASTSWS